MKILANRGVANDLIVSRGDVYGAGEGEGFAKYWKNGQEVVLSNKSFSAMTITVSGGDVFVVGYTMDSSTSNSILTYWKNGEEMNITSSSENNFAWSIAVVRK